MFEEDCVNCTTEGEKWSLAVKEEMIIYVKEP